MKKNTLKTIGFIVILLAVNIITSKTYGYYELTGFDRKFTEHLQGQVLTLEYQIPTALNME